MSNVPLEPYPYRVHSGITARTLGMGVVGVFMLAASAMLIIRGAAEGDYMLTVTGGSFFGILACVAFGSLPRGKQVAPFRYLNGEVMSKAATPVLDTWVHLAPTRPMRVTTVIAFAWMSLGAGVTAVMGVLQIFGLIPQFNPDATLGNLILAALIAAALSVGSGWILVFMVRQQQRNGTYGRRPTGVALGEQAITLRLPAKDAELRWHEIHMVDAATMKPGRAPELPLIRLHRLDDEGNRNGYVLFSAESLDVPPSALYTALRWYLAHPEARWELGRVEGERRIEAWRQQANQL